MVKVIRIKADNEEKIDAVLNCIKSLPEGVTLESHDEYYALGRVWEVEDDDTCENCGKKLYDPELPLCAECEEEYRDRLADEYNFYREV